MKRGINQTSSQHAKRAKVEEPEFSKLNQSDPVHGRRIQQRRRMVAFGKNTVGYDEYIKQVPKHKRRPRSMMHPSTPDHTLDIPTKRWQGLVRAWRKALHQYDPPDLAKAFAEEAEKKVEKKPKVIAKEAASVQERQLAEAATSGMLVDVSAAYSEAVDDVPAEVSPSTVATDEQCNTDGFEDSLNELDQWEKSREKNEHDFLFDDEDSDDDLL